jgi:hypothetical protein
MSLDNSFPEIAEANHQELCPFLGMAEDSQTSLSYPSAVNFCHRSRPYGTPKLDFQQSYCFSDNHSTCPVFTRNGRAPLPAEMLFVADRPQPENRGILLWLVGGIVVLLGLIGLIWGIQNRYVHGGSLFGILGNASPTVSTRYLTTGPALFTITPAFTISETATLQPPSATPTLESSSSATPTPTSSPSYTPTSTRTIRYIPIPVATNTVVFHHNSPNPPTNTVIPSTDTVVASTDTVVPSTDTPVPPTAAATDTSAPTASALPTQ